MLKMIEDGYFFGWTKIESLKICFVIEFLFEWSLLSINIWLGMGVYWIIMRIQGIYFYVFQGNSIERGTFVLLGIRFCVLCVNIRESKVIKSESCSRIMIGGSPYTLILVVKIVQYKIIQYSQNNHLPKAKISKHLKNSFMLQDILKFPILHRSSTPQFPSKNINNYEYQSEHTNPKWILIPIKILNKRKSIIKI